MSTDDDDWSGLMRLALAGDAAAYDRCLRGMAARLRAGVRRAIVRAGLAANDAEDVVQEILLAVHLKRHTWDAARPIGPWLAAIARHKTIDAIRRRGGRSGVPLDDVVDTLAAPSEEPAIRETELVRALETLPAGERAAVTAIAVDGAGIAEAAKKLGTSEGALRVALHRGLARLSRTAAERT
ncbi:sigma-70 family RNA polymerase sigma factor [Rhodoplanes sp. SY1]|uniref:sigma-70 family RNA polymerase sigma factor n=1 Tax=Rhodoplanes sp. SY1 TaxID=3166646 RepID=UPI0038B558D4